MYRYQKLLNPNEKVYFFGGMHWIVMSGSILMLIVMSTAGLLMDSYLHTRFYYPAYGEMPFVWRNMWSWLSYLPYVFTAVGLIWVICDAIRYLSTRVLLTSHRLITKMGWIMVKINEIELEEIKAAHIDQMLFGRFFGYGKIYFDARFVKDNTLPLMARPFDLVKLVHVIRDHHIGEKDDQTRELTSDDLPFIQASGEIESESKADELPDVQETQPETPKPGEADFAIDSNVVEGNEVEPEKPDNSIQGAKNSGSQEQVEPPQQKARQPRESGNDNGKKPQQEDVPDLDFLVDKLSSANQNRAL